MNSFSSRKPRIVASFIPCITQLLHKVEGSEFESGIRELLRNLKSQACVLEILALGKKLVEKSSEQFLEVSELVRELEPLRATRSLLQDSSCTIEEFTEAQAAILSDQNTNLLAMNRKQAERPSKSASKVPKRKYQRKVEKKYTQLSIDPSTMRLKNSQGNDVKDVQNTKAPIRIPAYNKNRPYCVLVQHIGASGTGFRCFIDNCKFGEKADETEFKNHLKEHKDIKWYSICTACGDNFGNSFWCSIMDEFEHLLTVHTDAEFLKESSSFAALEGQSEDNAVIPSAVDEVCEGINLLDLIPETVSEKLRPWLPGDDDKNKAAVLLMKKPERLAAFFKCMGFHCTFATAEKRHFAKHLDFHKRVDKETPEEPGIGYYKCSYCSFEGSEGSELITHIKTAHKFDRYRCDLCFYRSCSEESVYAHRLFYHFKVEEVAYECADIAAMDYEKELQRLINKPDKDLIVPVLICPLCKIPMRYDNTNDLEKHLKAYHKDAASFQCKKCDETVAMKSIREHYESCHKIGMWQCVHCCHGTDVVLKARMHVVDKHPSEFDVVCHRDCSGTVVTQETFFFGHFPLKTSFSCFQGTVFTA